MLGGVFVVPFAPLLFLPGRLRARVWLPPERSISLLLFSSPGFMLLNPPAIPRALFYLFIC